MRRTLRRSAASAGILAIVVLLPAQIEAQSLDTSISGWLGGIYDRFDEVSAFSPQVGGRIEVSPWPYLWIGGELTTRLDRGEVDCPDTSQPGCVEHINRFTTTVASAHVRLELANLKVKPYAIGTIGKVRRGGWETTVEGLGFGVRFPVGIVEDGVSMEVRHRKRETPFRSHGHWEFLLGVAFW